MNLIIRANLTQQNGIMRLDLHLTMNWSFIQNPERRMFVLKMVILVLKHIRKNGRILTISRGRVSANRRQQHFEYADYTSGRLNTRGKASWTYGKVEARAKLPQGRGVWPAFWMLGMDGRWPACGEIDIMEYVGFAADTIHANVHMAKYNHVKGNGKGAKIRSEKPYDDFHIYAIEWTEEKIDFFFDGKKYFTFENEHSGTDAWPFDQPEFIILNLAIGGDWGGQKGVDDAIFPQKYLVDYVRVYQKE